MSKHTPGPWEYIHDEDKTSVVVGGEDKRTIIHTHWEPDNPEAVADARLIAAAPEVTALLQELVDSVGGGGSVVTITDEKLAEYRAALAKARGQS